MKKGDVETSGLENFIQIVLHLSLLLGAAAIIFIFIIKPYIFPPLSEPQKDFVRLTDDVQTVLDAPTAQRLEISSPMSAKVTYTFAVYPMDGPLLPAKCKGESCICVIEFKENKPIETCKLYPDIKTCQPNVECGKGFCFKEKRIHVFEGQPISIPISKECNVVSVG